MKENKIISAVSVLFLLFSIPLTVFAIRAVQKPTETKGGYYHTLVDRIDVSADFTEFSFHEPDNANDTCEISFLLTVQKCEADLYARLDSISITGLSYQNAVFLCETPELENTVPENLLLPVVDGKSVPLTWRVTVTAGFPSKGDYSASVRLNYTSGLTQESADSRMLEIPLLIHVA